MKEENEPYALHLERQSKECTYSIVSRRVAHAEPKKKNLLTSSEQPASEKRLKYAYICTKKK